MSNIICVPGSTHARSMPKKLDVVLLQRKMGRGRPVTYEIRYKIAGFSSKDWERVVAVYVLGKDWQFKDWPFKDRVEIFNKSEQLLLQLAAVGNELEGVYKLL